MIVHSPGRDTVKIAAKHHRKTCEIVHLRVLHAKKRKENNIYFLIDEYKSRGILETKYSPLEKSVFVEKLTISRNLGFKGIRRRFRVAYKFEIQQPRISRAS